jgi:hypothetical protein
LSPEQPKEVQLPQRAIAARCGPEALTQAETAAALGVARRTVDEWEAVPNVNDDNVTAPPDLRFKIPAAEQEKLAERLAQCDLLLADPSFMTDVSDFRAFAAWLPVAPGWHISSSRLRGLRPRYSTWNARRTFARGSSAARTTPSRMRCALPRWGVPTPLTCPRCQRSSATSKMS